MTNTDTDTTAIQPTSVILFDAAAAYANENADTSIRSDLRIAFIAGAEWQREHQDDYDAFNGRLGTSDDAWRATQQATINQQAEEIERLREAERRLIAMVKVGTGAA